MNTNTLTETRRRIRVAAALARTAERGFIPSNARIEVGTRLVPVYSVGAAPSAADAFPEDDDLADYELPSGYLSEQVRREGYVAHLYFSNAEEFLDVVTVWLGDRDHEPELVHVPLVSWKV